MASDLQEKVVAKWDSGALDDKRRDKFLALMGAKKYIDPAKVRRWHSRAHDRPEHWHL